MNKARLIPCLFLLPKLYKNTKNAENVKLFFGNIAKCKVFGNKFSTNSKSIPIPTFCPSHQNAVPLPP